MPRYLQNHLWLVPICILSLSLGIYIILTLFLPEFNPHLCERFADKGVKPFAFFLGLACVASPITLLLISIEIDRMEESGEDEDGDLF